MSLVGTRPALVLAEHPTGIGCHFPEFPHSPDFSDRWLSASTTHPETLVQRSSIGSVSGYDVVTDGQEKTVG